MQRYKNSYFANISLPNIARLTRQETDECKTRWFSQAKFLLTNHLRLNAMIIARCFRPCKFVTNNATIYFLSSYIWNAILEYSRISSQAFTSLPLSTSLQTDVRNWLASVHNKTFWTKIFENWSWNLWFGVQKHHLRFLSAFWD